MKNITRINTMFLVLCFLVSCGVPEPEGPPNILWITSEDNGRFLACYGDPHASTPNLDALAAEGIRYSSCFANAPVCSLVRSSWILGVPAITTGTHHMRSWYRVPESLTPYPTLLKEAGYYVTNNLKTDYNNSSFEKEIWDECSAEAHYKNRQEGQAFFAVFNIGISHEGQIFERHYPDRYPEASTPAEGIEIPPYQVNTPETIRDWQRMYDRIHDMDAELGRLLEELEKSGEAENTLIFYCSDHGGITLRSKRFLYESGTHVPFIVYIPEKWKHLSPDSFGTVSDRLVQFIDMPKTFLSLAGAEVPEYMPGRILLGDDQEAAPESIFLFSGRFDEAPDMRRGITNGRWKYIRNYEPDRSVYQMLAYPLNQSGQVSQFEEYLAGRTNELQSAQYRPQIPEQLFDTQDDPHEINNLAGKPEHADRLSRMSRELDRQIMEARDAGFIPEPMMARIDRDSSTTLYDYCQNRALYPLEKAISTAQVASQQDPSNIPLLLSDLKHKNPIVRYWAILGLRALGEKSVSALTQIEEASLDSCEEVRINAAIVLGNLGYKQKAADLLLTEAQKANSDAHSNWALDGLRYLGLPEAIRGYSEEQLAKGPYAKRTYAHLAAGGTMYRIPEK